MADCTEPTKYGRCRKCQACIDNRISSWVLRLVLESFLYEKSYVTTATLTYRDECLPKNDKEAKHQFQKFMKRLRKDLGIGVVRYFAALEKGSQTSRYHWHVIFYGIPFNGLTRDYIRKKWGHGFVRKFEPVRSPGAMRYAAKYALKDRCYLASRRPPFGDGMIESINNTIDSLSLVEKQKIIEQQSRTYFIDKHLENSLTGCVIADEGRLFTITSLKLGGVYYPLHDFIKKRLRRFNG